MTREEIINGLIHIAAGNWDENSMAAITEAITILESQPHLPEGLEEEYQEFCKANPFPWSSQYVNREYIDERCLSVARHFFELGKNARKEK